MPKPIVTEDQRVLDRVGVILSAFSEVDAAMPIQVAQTFLMVVNNEGCSLTDIYKQTGWSLSTISRHLLDLGERDRYKNPGHNLIESRRDPMELRKNVYTLTPKGKKLAQKLLHLMHL
jgi:DNA-binding MarR family transcriptional regulator